MRDCAALADLVREAHLEEPVRADMRIHDHATTDHYWLGKKLPLLINRKIRDAHSNKKLSCPYRLTCHESTDACTFGALAPGRAKTPCLLFAREGRQSFPKVFVKVSASLKNTVELSSFLDAQLVARTHFEGGASWERLLILEILTHVLGKYEAVAIDKMEKDGRICIIKWRCSDGFVVVFSLGSMRFVMWSWPPGAV